MKKTAVRIAVINCKGGTAKTTTSVNLAHALANQGLKVLLCDLDPQASASLSFGFKNAQITYFLAEVLLENIPLREAVHKTSVERVDLLPGSMALSSFDITCAHLKAREYKLREVLSKALGYDVIIMDCPPTLGLLSLNAITAADELLVPMIPQYLALEGLATLTAALERIKAGIGCNARMLGILLTQVDRRSKATKEMVSLIRTHYKDIVFKTEIPTNTRLAEAPSHAMTIFQHDWSATGAVAYQALAHEVLTKIQQEYQ